MLFKRGKKPDDAVSYLGEGSELIGEISFTKNLKVNGTFRGKVRSDATFLIGRTARVDAEVNVKNVSVGGEFHGIIHASDRVEISQGGRVYGDIFSPCLIIEAGAVFEGRCNMSQHSAPKQDENALINDASSAAAESPSSLS